MRQITIHTIGRPADVAECVEVPDPVFVAGDQILVRVDAFPINPADLLLFRGIYPRNPANGDALGNEATGIVEAVGAAVRGIAPGDLAETPRADIVALYQRLSDLARTSALAPAASRRFHVSDIKAALAHAEETMGQGKTLVSFDRP